MSDRQIELDRRTARQMRVIDPILITVMYAAAFVLTAGRPVLTFLTVMSISAAIWVEYRFGERRRLRERLERADDLKL